MSEDMKQIKVVKRRGQNEHWKQGDKQKQIYILQQLNLTLIHKKITNSTKKTTVCVYVWDRACVYVCVCV